MHTLNAKASCDFNESTQIFHKVHYGIITISDIIDSWGVAFDKEVIPKGTSRYILDFREAHFEIEMNEIIQVAQFYDAQPMFLQARFAVITSCPEDIVVPILVQNTGVGYSTRPFSTLAAATKWLIY